MFSLNKNGFPTPLGFRVFLLKTVPAAFLAGIRLRKINSDEAEVSVRYKWLNKNPFNSIYFAVLSMAAEAATGILCLLARQSLAGGLSMIIIRSEGTFNKKAKGEIFFSCTNGSEIKNATEKALHSDEAVTIICPSSGVDEDGQVVATFQFTWSFKAKQTPK